MSGFQRFTAAVVALLLVAIAAVVVLSAADGPIGRGPDPTATPSPSPSTARSITPTSTASPMPTGSPMSEEDVSAALAEIEEQVIAIRGLPAPEIGPADVISREELGAELQALFDAEYPPEDRERDNLVVRAFGLLGPDEDLGELQLALLSEQVVGFYDSDDQRMVVVSETGLDAEAKLTYAHEYTHALQDAAFGLDTLETDAVGEDDRGLARIALIEGDATVTMLAWAFEHLSPEELLELGNAPVPDTADVPPWMLSQLLFPYLAGQEWIGAIMSDAGGTPLAPDFAAVDEAYADPPDSTAQIIDVQKWFDRVEPAPVEALDLAAGLGDGWEEVDSSPVGQASIGIVLEHHGVPSSDASDASDGWAGDRAVVVRGPDDAFALAWRVVWESEEDAAEFESAYDTVIDALEFPAQVTRDGDTSLVTHASDADLLQRAGDAAR